MKITILPFDFSKDALAATRLHRKTIREINFKDYSKSVIDNWVKITTVKHHSKIDAKGIRVKAVSEEGLMLGFADIVLDTKTKVADFNSLYVNQNYLGKGIGKQLYNYLENIAIDKGVERITVTSTITAKNFYI